MRFLFHYRAPFSKQLALLKAVQEGALRHGDQVRGEERFEQVRDVDGLVMLGIGGHSRAVFNAYRAAGKRVVFFDKGYMRGGGWYRVAVDDFQPLRYLGKIARPMQRFDALGLELGAYRRGGEVILLDGASNKYCLWQNLGEHRAWGEHTVRLIRCYTSLPIVYRPRPSHNAPLPVEGAELSDGVPLADDLARARVVVSYGGNIGWDCVIAGVPHFAIGDSIARPVSETDWSRIDRPYVPSEGERRQWCANVAYQQWTLDEIASGAAWCVISGQLSETA